MSISVSIQFHISIVIFNSDPRAPCFEASKPNSCMKKIFTHLCARLQARHFMIYSSTPGKGLPNTPKIYVRVKWSFQTKNTLEVVGGSVPPPGFKLIHRVDLLLMLPDSLYAAAHRHSIRPHNWPEWPAWLKVA